MLNADLLRPEPATGNELYAKCGLPLFINVVHRRVPRVVVMLIRMTAEKPVGTPRIERKTATRLGPDDAWQGAQGGQIVLNPGCKVRRLTKPLVVQGEDVRFVDAAGPLDLIHVLLDDGQRVADDCHGERDLQCDEHRAGFVMA